MIHVVRDRVRGVGSFEHDQEYCYPIKGGERIDQLCDYCLLEKNSAACIFHWHN
jgi:hypothetical protein